MDVEGWRVEEDEEVAGYAREEGDEEGDGEEVLRLESQIGARNMG